MEQVIENKIGKTVPFGLLSDAMNEPIGPVDNVIEKEKIHNLNCLNVKQGSMDHRLW